MTRKIFPLLIPLTFFTFLIFTETNLNAQQLPSEKVQRYSEQAGRIVRSALLDKKGYGWLKELCAIGPRLSGSENSSKATTWAKNKMEECGFDSVWLQPVMVPKWVRGKIENAYISKSKKYLNKKMTILELTIVYLKDKGMKYSEIALLLSRDQRNIRATYTRTMKKINNNL